MYGPFNQMKLMHTGVVQKETKARKSFCLDWHVLETDSLRKLHKTLAVFGADEPL